MKCIVLIILLISVQNRAICQYMEVDSLLLAYGVDRDTDLSKVSAVMDRLIQEDVPLTPDIVRYFSDLANKGGGAFYIAKSLFYETIYLDQIKDPGRMIQAQKALRNYNIHRSSFAPLEWADQWLSLSFIEAKGALHQGSKDASIGVHYRILSFMDSIRRVSPDLNLAENYLRNYLSMSNIFLFDNDEISTRYADSSIVWGRHSDDPRGLFRSYSMKYYTLYYGNDGIELNAIADSCIKYARILEDARMLGEAYMHKCNALVVLQRSSEGVSYCDLAIVEYDKLNDSTYLSRTLHNMGNVFDKAGESNRALSYYQRALNLLSEKDNDSYYNTLEAVASELHDLGRYREASEHYRKFSRSYYNFYSNKLSEKFSEAEAKYQSELKEAEIERQKLELAKNKTARNIISYGALGVIVVMASLFYSFYQRSQRNKKEQQLALKMEQQRSDDLEKMDLLKTTFFNNVSHELRTPLTLIIAPLEDAQKRVRNVDLQRLVNLALSNSQRLLNITNEILDLSKLNASKLKLFPSEVVISEFLHRVFHSFDSLARKRDISMEDNVSVLEGYSVEVDSMKLEKIINNLISNALKYSSDGGNVTLHIEPTIVKGDVLEFSIKDTGSGIPQSELSAIFDRYYQAHRTSHSSGTGIGLSLVKELIDLMEGNIAVQSVEGEGTVFTVSIPIVFSVIQPRSKLDNKGEPSDTKSDKVAPLLIKGKRPRVLIVEDDEEMSQYLVSLLQKEYLCDVAYNGTQALKMMETHHYDLITSDIMMPGMNGFEFREQVCASRFMSKVPFIFLSAISLEEDKLKAFRLGIDDYITKPFGSLEFLARVRHLISSKIYRYQMNEAVATLSAKDDVVERAKGVVLDHLDDPEFKVSHLAKELNYSTRQLSRLLQRDTGLTPVGFILEIRLLRAYTLIKERKFTSINEVRYEVGIESASYFTTKFKERFGISPSKFADTEYQPDRIYR